MMTNNRQKLTVSRLLACSGMAMLLLIGLSACKGSGVSRPSGDNSTDYKSAKSLPPLRKLGTRSATEQSQTTTQRSAVSAEVKIVEQNNYARIEIDTDINKAWDYMFTKLKQSDVTVHSRNQTASRFDIGCTGIDDPATLKPKRGWSFKKAESTEYCGLQLTSGKSVTRAQLLNRKGQEVSSAVATPVFQRILNL